MEIVVLNGSPKGEMSATLQYVHFIQKNFPEHKLDIINISQKLPKIEKDKDYFQKIIDKIKASDGVLWAFPLYYFLLHSNYKRFIELISENAVENSFENKYTAVLTTSIHFFDHTAHNYMNAVCDDLNMKYVGSFSADMYDLVKEKERERLLLFAEDFFEAVNHEIPTSKNFGPLTYSSFEYAPGDCEPRIDANGKTVTIVTDSYDMGSNLGKMINRFKKSFLKEPKVINLHDLSIKGGCLGCLQCGLENICVYRDQDDYMAFYNSEIKTPDILVFAGSIVDRYLSSKWKQFFDRSFFNGHAPSLMGKQMGFILSGPLNQIPNLRQIFESYTSLQHANLVDFVTDEYEDSEKIDALLENLAERLVRFSLKNYMKPANFLALGGTKVFRDDIWGRLRFVFQADHRFYKEHGLYDFPQNDYGARGRNLLMMNLTKIPAFKKVFLKSLKKEMIKPHQKMLGD